MDVAALAGVSMKSVSRVLNQERYVRAELRDKVLQAVEKLDYTPNHAARALAGSRAYLIGLYYDNPSLGYVRGIQFGALMACREHGYHLLIEQVDAAEPDIGRSVAKLLSLVKLDGLILSPPICDQAEVLDVLDKRGVPYVRIAPASQLDRGSYVYIDDEQAAYEMTVHLQKLGHRRIGFVKGHADHSAAPLRYKGFVRAMHDAGLVVPPDYLQTGNFSFRSGVGAGERLLNLAERPTAIFASNDDMALGVMTVANRMQLSLPAQLSVAGFDDSPSAQVVWPQLTTIRQPVEKIAFEAATMLFKTRGRLAAPASRLLDFELIERNSTGPAPQ